MSTGFQARMRSLFQSSATIFSLCAIPFGSVWAQEPVGQAVIGFEGGSLGADAAEVVKKFAELSGALPARRVFPGDRDGLCNILEKEIQIPQAFCSKALQEALATLNEKNGLKINPDAITPKEGVFLPDVKAETYEIERLFDKLVQKEKSRVDDIDANPAWEKLITQSTSDILASKKSASGIAVREIESRKIKILEWSVAIQKESDFFAANQIARDISTPNLSIDVERLSNELKSAFTAADAFYKQWCGATSAPVTADGSFGDLAGRFYETGDVSQCVPSDSYNGLPWVAIIDQEIARHPDLADALGDEAAALTVPSLGQACKRRGYKPETDHGTLLASIVASKKNNYGFVGVASDLASTTNTVETRKVKLTAFSWVSGVTNSQVSKFIKVNARFPVTLFASKFDQNVKFLETVPSDPQERIDAEAVWKLGDGDKFLPLLADENVRFSQKVSKEIAAHKSLFVIAAAQNPSNGLQITPETPMSPQNLGDIQNVLVVGACEDCSNDLPTIWPRSNYGEFVGVLAPGGQNIPVYVSENEVAEVEGGTSAAAAFVAGLAAKMYACYPDAYQLNPGKLKERLILASYPTAERATRAKLAGSVVDPSVSMLNPALDWFKSKSEPLPKAVTFNHWCSASLDLSEDDNSKEITLHQTRRLSVLEGGQMVQQVSETDNSGKQTVIKVARYGHLRPKQADAKIAAIELDGGNCVINAARLQDLFLSVDHRTVGDCTGIPLCNG